MCYKSLLLIGLLACATTPSSYIKTIRAHDNYKKLTAEETDLLEEIMSEASKSDKKDYYFYKLQLLLDTPQKSPELLEKSQKESIRKSVHDTKKERRYISKHTGIGIEEYISREEIYETTKDRHWTSYKPKGNDSYFYVSDEDPLDLLVHIKVHLNGPRDIMGQILLLEDAIEKHLHIRGFSVNLVFVGHPADNEDIFEVDIDPSKWPDSGNWAGNHKMLAHELMHLMGLPDEYNRIESHAGNEYLSFYDRLYWFKVQMRSQTFPDAKKGIMCNHWMKPLDRHACAAVGLGEECVKVRKKAFH